MRAGPFPTEAPREIGKRGRTRTCGDRNQNPAPWPAWRRARQLVLPTGVQPAKSSVESAVPLAPGDGRLARAAGSEPNTSCLEDRHAAHYATPARMEQPQWTRKAPLQRSASAIRLAGSDRSRWDHRPGSRDGGEYRDRTCASRRTRRVSTALPYRSANSPIQMVRSTGLEPASGRLEDG
jgi:hypothetical protein